MSAVQKAPWKRLADQSSRQYQEQKAIQDSRTVRYYVSDVADEERAAKRKTKATTAAAKTAKAKSGSSSSKTSATTAKVHATRAHTGSLCISEIIAAVSRCRQNEVHFTDHIRSEFINRRGR